MLFNLSFNNFSNSSNLSLHKDKTSKFVSRTHFFKSSVCCSSIYFLNSSYFSFIKIFKQFSILFINSSIFLKLFSSSHFFSFSFTSSLLAFSIISFLPIISPTWLLFPVCSFSIFFSFL